VPDVAALVPVGRNGPAAHRRRPRAARTPASADEERSEPRALHRPGGCLSGGLPGVACQALEGFEGDAPSTLLQEHGKSTIAS